MIIAKNKKNLDLYEIVSYNCIDCTNTANDIRMILYKKHENNLDLYFVRKVDEFYEKFEIIKEV